MSADADFAVAILLRMPGASWLGIGAQRSGTDWVSRLLCQHPKVDFGTNGKKEQSLLQRIPDGDVSDEQYLKLFPDDGVLRGDWSPRYLASVTVPAIAKRVLKDEAPLFVLLRDPVERFGSGMRHSKKLGNLQTDYQERGLIRAVQFGQYGSALESWASVFPRERFVIMTYEEARDDVQAACDVFWRSLGLKSHRLVNPYERVKKPTEGRIDWVWPEGTREALIKHYLPQVVWLRDHWDIDVKRWSNFERLI